MSRRNIWDLPTDAEVVEVDVKPVKLEPGTCGSLKSNSHLRSQELEENRSSNALSAGHSSNSVLEQGQSPVDDTGVSSSASISPAPICRQFWKAGNYSDGLSSKVSHQSGKNYLNVHPMFLHSNATSHKWAFGAIAELLDNAVDEIQNGATFVIVDKTSNPRDGSSALLIQDDGGGMDPQAMRHCMGFGFSEKKSNSAIGRYGNGFKTSSMRLGADVIVFSRNFNNKTLTQSVGLLSYTFLTRTGHDRIVVPIVDYEFNVSTSTFGALHDREHFTSNLSVLLQWSPYSTEEELLKQCDEIGPTGTRIIVYNLWFNDDGKLELDFDSDPKDIRIDGNIKQVQTKPSWKAVNEQHIASRFHYSLRVYLSILYLRIPESFKIILRGQVVEHHNVADDLKHPQYIQYKPQSGGRVEGTVVTTIGFLKEAPKLNIHGFCVYHKNRLIMPYWQVVTYSDSRGRGVVGVLEANFVEPTHNKQDFERTSLLQKLENRLKEMTWEYWDYHCELIGYQPKKKARVPTSLPLSPDCIPNNNISQRSSPVIGTQTSTTAFAVQLAGKSTPLPRARIEQVLGTKRKEHCDLTEPVILKRQAGNVVSIVNSGKKLSTQPVVTSAIRVKDQEAANLMEENKKLRSKCLESEKRCEEHYVKVSRLRSEIGQFKREYNRLLAELRALDVVKEEKVVHV